MILSINKLSLYLNLLQIDFHTFITCTVILINSHNLFEYFKQYNIYMVVNNTFNTYIPYTKFYI